MSESSRKWAFLLIMGLFCLGIGGAIHESRNPKYAPKPAKITHFLVHLPGSCGLRGYLILGGHTQSNMDAGDKYQQELWALAKECGGSIEIEPDNKFNNPGVPKGPNRDG